MGNRFNHSVTWIFLDIYMPKAIAEIPTKRVRIDDPPSISSEEFNAFVVVEGDVFTFACLFQSFDGLEQYSGIQFVELLIGRQVTVGDFE